MSFASYSPRDEVSVAGVLRLGGATLAADCAGALYWSKIGRVVYGAEDEKNGYRRGLQPDSSPDHASQGMIPTGTLPQAIYLPVAGAWPFHPRTELVKGVMKEECSRLMKEFFQSKR